MAQKKSSNALTLEDIEEAANKLANCGSHPDTLIMSKSNYEKLRDFLEGSFIELEIGDWVFITDNGNSYVAEVIEKDIEDITTEYKVHVKESTEVKKSIFLLLTGREEIKKVAAGSKLKSLLVLHGK